MKFMSESLITYVYLHLQYGILANTAQDSSIES